MERGTWRTVTRVTGRLGALALAVAFASPAAAGGGWTLIGWNDLGMHCMDDSYAVFSILPPYNTIHAQLIDPGGNRVTDPTALGITVTYEAVADPSGSINTTSAGKTDFWTWVGALFGASPPPDEGLAGFSMPGPGNAPRPMTWEPGQQWFTAEGIPLTPYDDSGAKNPYPLMRLVARDASGAVLATTDIVLPVSDEMDCRACHASGGSPAAEPADGWVNDPDPVRDYRLNVLRRHDDLQAGDPVYQAALAAAGYDPAGLYATVTTGGRPVLCDACHPSNALPGTGQDGISPLTRAVHAMHATVRDPETGMSLEAAANRTACYRCHPGSETRCLRGAMGHATAGDASLLIQCQDCHGTMSMVGSASRQGWLEEPTCQSCHTGTADDNAGRIRYTTVFDAPGHVRQATNATFATDPDVPAPGLSLYRFSTGHGGLACEACHGATHAIYPSAHGNDNIQSVQIQGHAGTLAECSACHTGGVPRTVSGGPHGMHPVGQAWVEDHKHVAEGGGGGGDDDAAFLDGGAGATQCQACHGTDYRGTVLSRALGDRTVQAFGTKVFWKGYQIGCYTCHDGPDSEHRNPNSPPQVGDASAISSGDPVTIPLVATDADGQPLELRLVSPPSHGLAGVDGTTATYVPDPGFVGTDTFTYAAWDGMADSNLGTVTVTVTGTGGCTVACQATGPDRTAPGQSESFFATATLSGCSGDPSFAWDFGDGTGASGRTVQHAYAAPGTYTWSVTVTADGSSCTSTGTTVVVEGGGCSLACDASAPPSAGVGEAVELTATASTSGCSGEPAYAWEFGDGATATGRQVTHAWTAPGTYTWSVTVTVDGRSCTSTGTIAIGDRDLPAAMLVAAHSHGAEGSSWRTDLTVTNLADRAADLELAFLDAGREVVRRVTLGPRSLRAWVDVLRSLFGIGDDVAGAVVVRTAARVAVASRIYNRTDHGSYGQYFPAATAAQAVAPGEVGVLAPIERSHDTRTNLGLLNLGTDPATVEVRLLDPSGRPVGTPLVRTLDGLRWLQIDDVLGAAGAEGVELAQAEVRVIGGPGPVWPYASVIDRAAGDPYTVTATVTR